MHSNWRDCQEWKKINVSLSTTNNESAKLYDAVLTQYVSWYDNPTVGGIEGSIEKLLKNEPDFVMGHVLANGLELMATGRSPRLDDQLQADLRLMLDIASKNNITSAEKLHVEAVKLVSEGEWNKAALKWEKILVDHPLDMLALKFAHDLYFYMGQSNEMRDSIARVLPFWKKDMPLYSYLYGQYSFGLVETNYFKEAEKYARMGLELNKFDAWSTHSLAHVFEMQGRHEEGVAFMSSTVKEWETCGMLACHNFWHWAIYHVERGEYQGAFDIFDSQINERCKKSGALLDVVDTASMLFRLEMEGQNVEERWNDVFEVCQPHLDDHLLSFNDQHFLLSCMRSGNNAATKKLMDSMEAFIRNCSGDQQRIIRDVGLTISKSLIAYNEGDYAKAVELLNPIRYEIRTIGGSNAQRDMFSLFLINAAIKSTKKEHNCLARHLLYERDALKGKCPMNERLMNRAIAQHAD